MSALDIIVNCQNCGKKLWLKYYKLPDGRTVCPKCFDIFIRTGEIDKLKDKEKTGKLESIFSCQNCGKTLWLKYYKLPDGRTVCPKCFDIYVQTKYMDKQMDRKKDV